MVALVQVGSRAGQGLFTDTECDRAKSGPCHLEHSGKHRFGLTWQTEHVGRADVDAVEV